MSTTDRAPRRLTRSECAALLGGKHRCLLNHPSPDPYLILTNSQSPIARLSNEELLLIFEAALEIVIFNATAFGQRQEPDILVAISHVSRRWRAIALSHTGLWSHMFPCSLSGVEQHLSRSGARPLTVFGLFPSQRKDESDVIAAASTDNTKNVVRLLQSTNAYPMLEWLEFNIPQCVPLEMGAANASNTILFPTLQTLGLTRVHPMVLPRSAMPALFNLKLYGLGHNLYLSQLLSLLSGTPALRVLMLRNALPLLDPHRLVNIGLWQPRWLPTGPLRCVPGTPVLKLPQLVSLSLNPAPASGLWALFLFLELPALATLDLHVYTDPHNAHWPGLTRDGRPFVLTPRPSEDENPSSEAWTVRLPALRTLRITYCVPPACAPAPSSNRDCDHCTISAAAAVVAADTLPRLRRIVFPGLKDLQIAHALVCDPDSASDTPWPPLQPLPTFDALFQAPNFSHLTRLTLSGCALPLQALCEALRTRMPALEALTLGPACLGAGALVCALAPGDCGGGCERVLQVDTDPWVGRKVSMVVLRRCTDVRAGCLRKVIEARLRASTSAADAGSELESTGTPSQSSGEPALVSGSKVGRRLGRPERITQIQVLECVGIAKGDVAALAAIPGAPDLYWSPAAMG